MPTLDVPRFFFSLAGKLRAGEWTAAGLRVSFTLALADRPVRVPGLLSRLLAKFRNTPEFMPLVLFLMNDAGMQRAVARITRGFVLPRRVKRVRPVMSEPRWLGDATLPSIPTETALAEWLGIEPGRLRWYADLTGRNRHHPNGPLRTYQHRWVPKPGGCSRLLEIPRPGLRYLQRRILDEILSLVPTHATVHGFVRERSAITNAACHCGQAIVIKFDLADFFPSIPANRVFRIFRAIGYPEIVAKLLAGLCTTRTPSDVLGEQGEGVLDHAARLRFTSRHLPQGAPTSPALANLAAHRLDRRLAALAASIGMRYTRYADDLTVSAGPELGDGIARLTRLVTLIASEEGFSVNAAKTRVMRRGHQQVVTGLVVNARPNVPRADFDQLKAILTNCVRHGPISQNRESHHDFRAHLAGKIAHVAAVNHIRGRKLWALFDKIAWQPASGLC